MHPLTLLPPSLLGLCRLLHFKSCVSYWLTWLGFLPMQASNPGHSACLSSMPGTVSRSSRATGVCDQHTQAVPCGPVGHHNCCGGSTVLSGFAQAAVRQGDPPGARMAWAVRIRVNVFMGVRICSAQLPGVGLTATPAPAELMLVPPFRMPPAGLPAGVCLDRSQRAGKEGGTHLVPREDHGRVGGT